MERYRYFFHYKIDLFVSSLTWRQFDSEVIGNDQKHINKQNITFNILRSQLSMATQGGGTLTPAASTTMQNTCNKVFIQRDYSEGTSVKFHTRLPSELEGVIFESTINRLNDYYVEAEKGSCSTYCEGCIGCITAYLVFMCSETHYEKTLRKISKFVASQNERIYNPKGLQIVDPTYRGLRVIEICILDRPGRT